YNSDTVDVSNTKLTNTIWLIGWLRGSLKASADDLAVISVDILHPLKQGDALRTFLRSHKVNGGVVAPHYRVSLISEVECKNQHIAIKGCASGDIRYV